MQRDQAREQATHNQHDVSPIHAVRILHIPPDDALRPPQPGLDKSVDGDGGEDVVVSGEALHDLCDVVHGVSGEREGISLCAAHVDEGDAAVHAGEDVGEDGVAMDDAGGAAAAAARVRAEEGEQGVEVGGGEPGGEVVGAVRGEAGGDFRGVARVDEGVRGGRRGGAAAVQARERGEEVGEGAVREGALDKAGGEGGGGDAVDGEGETGVVEGVPVQAREEGGEGRRDVAVEEELAVERRRVRGLDDERAVEG